LTDRQIPVFATAFSSFRFVLMHRRELLRLGWLAVPAFLIVIMSLDSFDAVGRSGPGGLTNAVRSLIDLGARAAIATVVLVAWHRVVMLKAGAAGTGPTLAFGLREARYLLVWLALSAAFVGVFVAVIVLTVTAQFAAMIVLYLMLLLVGLADTLVIGQRDQFIIVLWVAVFFAVPAASYVTGRLALVLPALAVDRRRPLRQAWRMSAGNGWRLVAASLLVMAPMESIATLFSAAAASARHGLAYYPFAVAAAVSLFLLIVLTGTVLSLFSLQLDSATRGADAYHSGVAVAE
jgi:hypothetical protein